MSVENHQTVFLLQKAYKLRDTYARQFTFQYVYMVGARLRLNDFRSFLIT